MLALWCAFCDLTIIDIEIPTDRLIRYTVHQTSLVRSNAREMTAVDEGVQRLAVYHHGPLSDHFKEVLSKHPRALCTDIDGTLSATAPTVEAAVLLPGMRGILAEATRRFDVVATLSGRSIHDQRRMIAVPGVQHVGHHGYEWEDNNDTTRTILLDGAEPYLSRVAETLNEIELELAPQVSGLYIERKGITGGIHWRLARDHRQAEEVILPVVERRATAHGLRTRGGRLAIEILPPIATDKGEALQKLIDSNNLKAVIYMGDDLSDIDAFRKLHQLREQGLCQGITVGVLHDDSPPSLKGSVDMVLESTDEVPHFLNGVLAQAAV